MGIESKVKQLISDESGHDLVSIKNDTKLTYYLNAVETDSVWLGVEHLFGLPQTDYPSDIAVYTVQDLIDYAKSKKPSSGGDAYYDTVMQGVNSQFGLKISRGTANRFGGFQELVNFTYNTRYDA